MRFGERKSLRKTVSVIFFSLLLMGMLALAFNVQPVKASGTIYIRADGSIDPPTAPISTMDNVTYILTGNITSNIPSYVYGIVVERSNVVVDGAEYTLQGPGGWDFSRGISLSGGTNVTIQNIQIRDFRFGIMLSPSSNYNNIRGNDIRDTFEGITLNWSSNYNSICGNNLTANMEYGIWSIGSSNSNNISGNTIADNSVGIGFYSSNYNNVSGNNLTDNYIGMGFEYGGISYSSSDYNNFSENNITGSRICGISFSSSSSNNRFYHNFLLNSQQVNSSGYANVWDDGYPSGGNCWGDYKGVDIDGDGIGDTPYFIDTNNQDNYPLRSPYEYWRSPLVGDVNRDMRVDMRDIGLVCSRFLKTPITLAEKNCDLNADNIINMRDIGIACTNFGKHYTQT